MNDLVTDEYEIIQNVIAHNPASVHGLRYDIVEYERWWAIRLYRNNYDSMIESKRVILAEWVSHIISLARRFGIEIYLEVEDH